jgi:hypothetical protein
VAFLRLRGRKGAAMPSTATDRLYGITTSVAIKPPCRVATTANITLTGLQTVDGVALAADDRVLVKNQTSSVDNGIYEANTSAWTRSPDFDGARDVVDGSLVIVREGSTNSRTVWEIVTDDPVVIGTSELAFERALLQDSATAAFIQAGDGAVERTAQAKMRERITVRDFGAVGDGVTDDTLAIQRAITAAAANGGCEVELDHGDFLISSAINRPANVYLVGRGPQATRIKTAGNHKLIQAIGSSGAVINRGGVISMTLLGSGLANTGCEGVHEEWTNRSILEDLIVYGTYKGIYAGNVWQSKWVNLQPNGSGSDQNAIGFYMAEVDPSNQNNAVNASGCVAQGVSLYGWRIINGNGSKLVNCEGLDGVHGFYVGDPTTGTEKCRWIHFANCLADTNSGHNWRFEKGAATALEQIQLANCWGGTSGSGANIYLGSAGYMAISNPMLIAANKNAIEIYNSTRIAVSGGMLAGFDAAVGGSPGILLRDSQKCSVAGAHVYTDSASAPKAVTESGTADDNLVMGNWLDGGYTRVGTNSRFMRNQGAGGERRGSAVVPAGSTSVTVTHNCEGTPSIDDVSVTPRDLWGSTTKWSAQNMTATTFDIVVDIAPGGTGLRFKWAIDQIGQ